MPFDLKKALDKVAPEKRAALEAALKESQGFIDSIEELNTNLETATKVKVEMEAKVKEIEGNYDVAYKEYQKMVDDLDASEKDRAEAGKKLAKAEEDKTRAQAALAEQLKIAPKIDTSNFLTREEAARLEAGRAGYFAKTFKTLQEHKALFNEDLDVEQLMVEAQAAKKLPDEFWKEKYKVDEKRAAISKEAQEKHDKELEDRGYQRAISESRNPALRTLESSEDPFYTPKSGDKVKQPWEMGDEMPEDEQKFMKEIAQRVQ